MSHLLESGTIERDKFQREAVSNVLQVYQNTDRGQIYAPTGSGKTPIAAKVWSRLAVPGIFVMVSPTRSVAQAAEKFAQYYDEGPNPATQDAEYLQVNSNPDATRDLNRIIRFLRQAGPRLVFATDTSLPLVTAALRALSLQADLFVIDETHRNTSARTSDSPRALWAEEAVINLPARRRLYMTATPRTWDAGSDDLVIFSQDDEEKYGPVAYELSFDDAVRRGIVLPIVPYFLKPEDEAVAQQLMADPKAKRVWGDQAMDYREMITHVAIWRARTDGLPDQYHRDERYRPRRILVSFNRKTEVNGFVARHKQIMRALGVDDGTAFAFLGSTPAGQREEIHESVSKLQGPDGPLAYAVIAQCGALTESYDLPDLDMAILVTPKHSTVAIQQLIGRITRKPVEATGKRWASVLTTDLVADSDELANTPIMDVVRALTTLSETFRHQLQKADVQEDNTPPPVRLPAGIDGQRLPDAFFEKLRLAFVPVTAEPWFPKFLVHLDEYIAAHGDARVPTEYVSPDGYRLGGRTSLVRCAQGKSRGPRGYHLSSEELAELNGRSFVWQIFDRPGFPGYLLYLDQYIAEHGDARVPIKYVCPDGYRLGTSTQNWRSRGLRGEIPLEQMQELDARGFIWHVRSWSHGDKFPKFIAHFKDYQAASGNDFVPNKYVCPDDGYKLGQYAGTIRQSLSGRGIIKLRPEQIAELDALGFARRPPTYPGSSLTLVANTLTEVSRPLTVTELADLTGLSQVVIYSILPRLESEGKAIRSLPPRGGKRTPAHLWQAAPATGSAD